MKEWRDIFGWLVFLAATAWMLKPVFEYVSFYTNDGPSHLYNSVLLKQLLAGDLGIHSDYLELNTRLEPNYLGHVLLVLLLTVTPPLVAEKLLVALYVILFLFGFRYLVAYFNKQASWTTLVAVPFVYSFPLHIGFYNFCFGLVLLLFTLGYWLRSARSLSTRKAVLLAVLFLLGFFSHVTTFLLTVACIGAFELYGLFTERPEGFSWSKAVAVEIGKKWGLLLLTLLPTLVLLFMFFRSHGGGGIPENTEDPAKQWADLMALRPITVFNHFEEEKFTPWLFFTFLASVVAVLFAGVFSWERAEKGLLILRRRAVGLLQLRHAFLLLAIVFLYAYFLLPDWMASGGYVHVRLLLLFLIMLLLWVSTARIPLLFLLPLIIASIMVTELQFTNRAKYRVEQNALVHELLDVADHIPEGSTVLPIIENHHWFFLHAGNYLGALKPLIILDNYEADAGYFPLTWKLLEAPSKNLGFPVAEACGESVEKLIETGIPVDAIVHYADGSREFGVNCDVTLEQLESEKYRLVHTSRSGRTKVYIRNSKGN